MAILCTFGSLLRVIAKKSYKCQGELAQCGEDHFPCCEHLTCIYDESTDIEQCKVGASIQKKFAVAAAYLNKYKPHFSEDEIQAFVELNQNTFMKMNEMLMKKHESPSIWELWDSISEQEQGVLMAKATEIYGDEESLVGEEERGEFAALGIEISDDGAFEI